MTRAAKWLFSAAILLFVGLLASHDLGEVWAMLAQAGWGLLLIAAFHLLPLSLDALAIAVLFSGGAPRANLTGALLGRWIGESTNSLLPAGQIGGPVLMARYLVQRGKPLAEAAATITVSTTLQAVAQIVFALIGVALLVARASHVTVATDRLVAEIAAAVLVLQVAGFYFLQRRGLFGKVLRTATRFAQQRNWSALVSRADAIDLAIQAAYTRSVAVGASFLASLVGWIAGTGEVYLIAVLLGFPVDWRNALLLESLGQAIRGAAFAIPGALGVQEGGYLLLAPMVGWPADAALALSLAKRTRELLLGIPGLLYWQVDSSRRLSV
jgi:putative membrane protein